MDSSNNDQVFHSSDIAKQTLAGSAVDPFTLTDKEKKRQEKRAEQQEKRVRKKAQRAAKKAERAAKFAAFRGRLGYWRKSHPLAFILSATGLSVLTIAILFVTSFAKYVRFLLSNVVPKFVLRNP